MRGKDGVATEVKKSGRITPVHAGKRSNRLSGEIIRRDHPRTCGEKVLTEKELDYCKGSPPHMRGKVWQVAIGEKVFRITPAHAGKSSTLFML